MFSRGPPKYPLANDFFPTVNLSPDEHSRLLTMGRELVPKLVQITESMEVALCCNPAFLWVVSIFRCVQGWKFVKESDGIRIYQQQGGDGGGIQMFRFCTSQPVKLAMDSGFGQQLLLDTTDKLRSVYPKFDPMFQDGQVR